MLKALCSCCSCNGCGDEVYWSEWHNDPPRCCDPCDCNGNWVGPSYGYRAPYEHPYAPGGAGAVYTKSNSANSAKVVRNAPVHGRKQVARQPKAKPSGKYQW